MCEQTPPEVLVSHQSFEARPVDLCGIPGNSGEV